ncbi:shikimate kinase [Mesonia sp. HuA40]|uniref:shikimate kinase n=1 Tax=Mesonia sp. HuA40 TaxID=2602761 RepID=UPI0011C94F08|nr:shikimate kinase [Mesonia sp. HuA40]TXK72305.1 shikimate kinase [Mesonia sp. HuA40]
MKIVLMGYMGSGKSYYSRLLAKELGFKYLDLDLEIKKKVGKSISAIFSSRGEIFFRKLEHEMLEELLKTQDNFVLALGGGTPCYGNNLELIAKTTNLKSIYIKRDLNYLLNVLWKEKAKRPMIAHLDKEEDLEDFIRKHMFERQYYYQQADLSLKPSNDLDDTLNALKQLL